MQIITIQYSRDKVSSICYLRFNFLTWAIVGISYMIHSSGSYAPIHLFMLTVMDFVYKLTGCNPEHINEERARCERRQVEAGRQRKNPLCSVLRRRKHLNLTADKDGHMFSVIINTLCL